MGYYYFNYRKEETKFIKVTKKQEKINFLKFNGQVTKIDGDFIHIKGAKEAAVGEVFRFPDVGYWGIVCQVFRHKFIAKLHDSICTIEETRLKVGSAVSLNPGPTPALAIRQKTLKQQEAQKKKVERSKKVGIIRQFTKQHVLISGLTDAQAGDWVLFNRSKSKGIIVDRDRTFDYIAILYLGKANLKENQIVTLLPDKKK
jgi:F0F1-type ATP synthase alpha subunit